MAELFNAFNFGITFDVDENTSQQVDTGYQYPDTLAETDQLFIAMFGDTYGASAIPYCYLTHCVQSTSALFGRDTDEDSLYNAARVFDDYQNKSTGAQGNGYARITNDYLTATTIGLSDGVALVRDISAVPVPAAVWLFGSGLIGLVGLARRKR
jgi:hypothetical protein